MGKITYVVSLSKDEIDSQEITEFLKLAVFHP